MIPYTIYQLQSAANSDLFLELLKYSRRETYAHSGLKHFYCSTIFHFLAYCVSFDMKIVVILFPEKYIYIPSLLVLTRDFRTKQWSNRLSVSKWITLLPQERSFIVTIILQSVYTYNSKHVIFSTLKMQVAPQK